MEGTQLKGNWRKNFDYRFISGEDLTKDVTLTIKAVTKEEVFNGHGKELALVIWFEETEKGIVCNKTNAKTISKLAHSPLVENWVGVKVILYPKTVNAFGAETEAVRVKLQKVS